MVLLRIALQRRFNTPFAQLMHQRITGPLGMTSTALPLPRDLLGRAVQGYNPQGQPLGKPGMEGGNFEWRGSGQIYSSARDMATFLAANLGDLADHSPIESAMAFTQQPVFKVSPRLSIGLAWQIVSSGNLQNPRQERWTEQHIDLHRVCSAKKVRRSSFSLTEVNNTPRGLADKSCMRSRKINHSRQPKANRSARGIDARGQLGVFHWDGLDEFGGLHRSAVAAALCVFRGRYRVRSVLFIDSLGRSAIFSTLCHRAVRAKHTGQVVSSLGVNTTPACRV